MKINVRERRRTVGPSSERHRHAITAVATISVVSLLANCDSSDCSVASSIAIWAARGTESAAGGAYFVDVSGQQNSMVVVESLTANLCNVPTASTELLPDASLGPCAHRVVLQPNACQETLAFTAYFSATDSQPIITAALLDAQNHVVATAAIRAGVAPGNDAATDIAAQPPATDALVDAQSQSTDSTTIDSSAIDSPAMPIDAGTDIGIAEDGSLE